MSTRMKMALVVMMIVGVSVSARFRLLGAQARTAPVASKPNVIVILADDLGYGDTSAYGSTIVRTPNIDALAASGVRFTDGYVTHPVCAPSRAGLLTGRYQERFGHEFNGSDKVGGVSLNEIMLPKAMKESGYATGMVGKWHQGPKGPYYPTERGFDFFWGMSGGGTNYITNPQPGDEFGSVGSDAEINDDDSAAQPQKKAEKTSPSDSNARQKNNKPGKPKNKPGKTAPAELLPSSDLETLRTQLEAVRTKAPITHNGALVHEEEYLTDAMTREASSFIDQNHDHPFFLYVAYHAPHTPLQATKKYYDRFPEIADNNTRIHAAMISSMDDGIGAIEATLKTYGLDSNTMVFFLSDNGCPSYLNGACSNGPLTGGKRTHFEGGVRIPFILSWPGHAPAGRVEHRTVSSLDIFPTAVVAAYGKLPSNRSYDGVDLMPFLTGGRNDSPNPVLYWRAGGTLAVRDHDWKMIVMNNAPPDATSSGGRKFKHGSDTDPSSKPPYAAIYGQHTMLYDLKTTPAETNNMASQEATITARLKAKLAEWNKLLAKPQVIAKQAYEVLDGVLLHLYD
jgi:arylsulfatase A-like enzyme